MAPFHHHPSTHLASVYLSLPRVFGCGQEMSIRGKKEISSIEMIVCTVAEVCKDLLAWIDVLPLLRHQYLVRYDVACFLPHEGVTCVVVVVPFDYHNISSYASFLSPMPSSSQLRHWHQSNQEWMVRIRTIDPEHLD